MYEQREAVTLSEEKQEIQEIQKIQKIQKGEEAEFKGTMRIIAAAMIVLMGISHLGPVFINRALSAFLQGLGYGEYINMILMPGVYYNIIETVCRSAAVCIAVLIIIFVGRKRFYGIRMFRVSDSRLLLACTGAALAAFALANVLNAYTADIFIKLWLIPEVRMGIVPFQTGEFISFFLAETLFPSVLEGLLFQGVILYILRRYSDGFAILFSALLAALFEQNFVYMAGGALIAMVVGYYVVRTNSVMNGIIMHFIIKSAAILMMICKELIPGGDYKQFLYICMMVFIFAGMISFLYSASCGRDEFKLKPGAITFNRGYKIKASVFNLGIVLFSGLCLTSAAWSVCYV